MKKLILASIILFSLSVNAQKAQTRFDFRFGVGTSLLGSGDMRTIMVENEINYSSNMFLTFAISTGYGKSDQGVYETSSFIQGNANIFLSPFGNNKKNDFRIGTGFSYLNVSNVYIKSSELINGTLLYNEYQFENRNLIGMNIILEDTYSITERLILGLKVFTQPYIGNINSGILLKIGVKI
jgi:hypothetical protein